MRLQAQSMRLQKKKKPVIILCAICVLCAEGTKAAHTARAALGVTCWPMRRRLLLWAYAPKAPPFIILCAEEGSCCPKRRRRMCFFSSFCPLYADLFSYAPFVSYAPKGQKLRILLAQP